MKNLFLSLSALLLTFSGYTQTLITTSVTIDDSAYDADGYYIAAGGQLYMDPGIYSFNTGAGLSVLTGGYLRINGPNTELKCSSTTGYWQGIQVYGATVPYNPANAWADNFGLASGENYIIERAKIGVYMTDVTAAYNTGTGSIVTTGNGYARSTYSNSGSYTCKFINNDYYGFVIINDNPTENYSQNNAGEWVNYYFESNSSNYVADLDFTNTNMMTALRKFEIIAKADGIQLHNSNINIHESEIIAGAGANSIGILHKVVNNNAIPTRVMSCKIRGDQYGVYTAQSRDFYMNDSEVSAINTAVMIRSCKDPQVFFSKIRANNTGLRTRQSEGSRVIDNQFFNAGNISAFVEHCEDTKLQGNSISFNSPLVLSNEGIYVVDSDSTRIVRNQFRRAMRQLHFEGNNTRVRITCNTFEDPNAAIDAAIMIDGAPINNQGDFIAGANNSFALLPPAIIRVQNNTGVALAFINTTGFPSGANVPSVGTFFFNTPAFPMNCVIPKMAQSTDVDDVVDNTPVPNPFIDYVTVGENINAVQVYSIGGQLIDRVEASAGEINLGHLASGTYIIVLHKNDGSTARHKVIKQ